MKKDTIIKVLNRSESSVGYTIPEQGIRRQFAGRQEKEITFKELEDLVFTPGGDVIIRDFLIVKNEEALRELLPGYEPEYFYTEKDVKRILEEASMAEFLDCLDFAPEGVLDLIKNMAVSLPLNNVQKRDAILKKLSFDVTRAIEIQNTKFDGDSSTETDKAEAPVRRVEQPKATTTARRAAVPTTSATK